MNLKMKLINFFILLAAFAGTASAGGVDLSVVKKALTDLPAGDVMETGGDLLDVAGQLVEKGSDLTKTLDGKNNPGQAAAKPGKILLFFPVKHCIRK